MATALGTSDRQAPAAVARPVLDAAPDIEGVTAEDACGLLSDQDLLRATGATSVVSRVPGAQEGAPAGCEVVLQPPDGASTPWKVRIGVQPDGGAARLDQEIAVGGVRIGSGIGDRSVQSTIVPAWSAVRGDVYARVSVVAVTGSPQRPPEDMARLLLFRVMARLRVTATGPDASAGPSPRPRTAARGLVERLRAPDFGADQVAAATEILARSGVATYERPDSVDPVLPVTDPASPLVLLADQVRAMALEAWAGGGFSGADLDALAPSPAPDLASGAEIVAGYVGGVDTEGAQVARALVGDIDPTHPQLAVFPQLVLMLMVSDVARDQLGPSPAAGRLSPRRPMTPPVRAIAMAATSDVRTAAGGPCTAVTGFIDGAISSVFDALKARVPDGGPGQVVVSIWNFVVKAAASAARTIVKGLTQPVLDAIATVAGTVGLAATIVSAIRPWTLAVTSDPPVTAKGIDGSPGQPGELVVRVDLGGMDEWPAAIQDCAAAAGRPLPNLKPQGAPVTWTAITQAPVELVAAGVQEATLDKDGIARFDFVTLTEAVPQPREEQAGRISVTVTVQRTELEQLRDMATDQLLGALPSIAREALSSFVRPLIASVTARLTHLITTQSSGSGWVIYHEPKRTPDPSATPTEPPVERAVMVRLDRPAIPPRLAGTVVELYSCGGPYGDWTGVLRFGGLETPDGFKAAFADAPVELSFPGAGGVQVASAPFEVDVPTNVVAQGVDLLQGHLVGTLDAVVDGRTMSVSGRVQASTTIVSLSGELGDVADLPIEPAPEGTCP
ncbi:MAG: hypothetical protein U0667_15195 [Chloroflexota bacterium]